LNEYHQVKHKKERTRTLKERKRDLDRLLEHAKKYNNSELLEKKAEDVKKLDEEEKRRIKIDKYTLRYK
jgi:hypothetical protein